MAIKNVEITNRVLKREGSSGSVSNVPSSLSYDLRELANKVDNSFFGKLFSAIDSDGNVIPVNGSATPVRIRANFDFFSVGESSAFGIDSSGGGGGGGGVTVYDGLDSTNPNIALSANQGRVLKGLIDNMDLSAYALKSELATVATSGSYNDLTNKPTIPAAQVQSNWNATSGMGVILNKPTKVSAFTNDANYVTSSSLTTTLASYATQTWVTNKGYATTSAMNAALEGYLPLTGGTLSGNLSVERTGTTGGKVTVANGNGSVSLLTSTNRGIYDDTNSSWLIATNGTNTFLMDGNVGINTTSPSYKLHVDGTVYAGRFYANSSNYISGSATNIFIQMGDMNPLVVTSATVRRGAAESAAAMELGTSTYRWANVYSVLGNFSGLITASGNIKTASYIEIGDYRIVADTANTALKVVHKNGTTAVNFYATGENSALGVNTSGGSGGGDGASLAAVWTSLGDSTGTYGSSQINASHLTNALASYATQSWVEAKGYLTSYTETDPVFTASAAHGITSADITSWNSKPSRLHSSMDAGECVRIQFNSGRYTAMVFVRGGKIGIQLVLVGTGYGASTGGNQWTQLSNGVSEIVWSIPKTGSITKSIEISNTSDAAASIDVITFDGDGCTITKIDALTTTGVNNPMIDADSVQTLSGVKTFSAQIKSTVATGTSPLVVASTTLVSNLNADLLDGVHLTSLVRKYPQDDYDLNELGVDGSMYRLGNANTNAFTNSNWGNVLVVGVRGADTCYQLGAPYGTQKLYFRTGSWYSDSGTIRTNPWKEIAFTDSNVASATTLETSRTLWGQNFDGSANVSGDMTGVGNLTASGNINVSNGNGAIRLMSSTGRGVYDVTSSKWLIGTNGTDTYLMEGNVGINTTTPVHKLHVKGDAYVTNLYLNGKNRFTGSDTQLVGYIGDVATITIEDGVVRRSNSNANIILGTSTYRWANVYSVLGNFSGLITASGNIKTASYIEIGDYRIVADTENTALKVVNKDGTTAVNFYATGENSALGVNTSGGGGGGMDIESMWTQLGNSDASRKINYVHIQDALTNNGYATQSWVNQQGFLKSYTETDPVFTASAAHGITSANITSWNNKVSNVQADWNATSGLAVILNKPTNLVTTTSLNTALSDYLPLAGGTMTGRLITRDVGSTWAYGFSPNYSAITFPAIDDNLYHPYLHGTSSDGSVWNLGGYGTRVGIYGYVADHEGNYTDWSTWWNTTNGYLTHSGGMNVGGQITSSVANGTAPLVIASSTLVSNLNADLLDGYHATELARLGWVVLTTWNTSSPKSCIWREIDAPATSSDRVVYDIVSFVYGYPYISYYRLTLFSYGTTHLSVSLVNLGTAHRNNGQSRICVGVATDGKVYIQNGSINGYNFLYVRNILSTDSVSAGTIHTDSVGEAAFGTANGFTAAKIITDTGYCRVNRSTGAVDTSGDPSITTSLRIGDACIWWDETNNCLRITGANANGLRSTSVAVNVNVSGEVSALKTS